jgi:uncharacterized protein YaiL (DUF2058 family)
MSGSLRDQLMGLGFKPAPKTETKPERRPPVKPDRPSNGRGPAQSQRRPGANAPAPSRPRGEMDLGKAYAIRAQKEKDERIAAEKQRQEEAQRKREGKARLASFLKSAALNDAAAEVPRHFEYGGKIRRIYVTPEQLKALNAGDLGVVQQGGRYTLVTAAHAREAEAMLAGALALLVDPSAPVEDDAYADPRFQVPDDLVW